MTAEVAVLNKSGVALAADSAVTTEFRGREKIFTTANKIFTLSKVHPVGIMINGNVEHFGCPWEIIIKEFRARQKDTGFGDLRGYVDAFVSMIREKRFLSEHGQAASVVMTGLSTLGELEGRMRDSGKRWEASAIKGILGEMIDYASKRAPIPGFDDIKQRTFDAQYGSYLDEICDDGDDGWADKKVPRTCRSLFKAAVLNAMTHALNTQLETGIVIAGYGHDDLFPKLYEISVDGGFLDKVRCFEPYKLDMGTDPIGAEISTFAQDATVQAFLNGLDEKFSIFHTGMFTHTMQLVADELLKEHTTMNADERRVAAVMINQRINEAIDDFREESDDFSQEEFRVPVLEVLRTAPKETLAELAESLVSITSLRQRVSGDAETVSGPVDVALISKGDGFIWIKRKHYFDTELNPHYTRNYFHEVDHG
jgi:hypothetical protein